VRPGDLAPDALADAMVHALSAPPITEDEAPDLRGRQRAVAHLLAQRPDVLPLSPTEPQDTLEELMSEA
jgi:hypothetical protein